ncbi:hypothetical protein VNO78_32046 [Psophocarpus tetragonolobus]|uniref:Uncharacterized protein n=1 Tax=Psophocarpus tetragonolobus TaxID=3891 RepID=A0AAN9X8B9_PSOTE
MDSCLLVSLVLLNCWLLILLYISCKYTGLYLTNYFYNSKHISLLLALKVSQLSMHLDSKSNEMVRKAGLCGAGTVKIRMN